MDSNESPNNAGAVELHNEDLDAISGGPTATEYAVMLSEKFMDKAPIANTHEVIKKP